MNSTSFLKLTILTFAAAGVAGCGTFGLFRTNVAAPPEVAVQTQPAPPPPTVEFLEYKRWTRVTAKPHKVISRIFTLCASPTDQQIEREKDNPHTDKYVVVYVNETGRKAMLEQPDPHFPVGSVIVKEKLATEKSTTPDLLTVMIKRDKGFNPDGGDWEYLVSDGTASEVKDRGKLATCMACHDERKAKDYIFRPYVRFGDKMKLQ
jgi:Cytochrome P460